MTLAVGEWPANNATLRPASQRAAGDFYYSIVMEWGGQVIEPSWLGTGKPHRVQCQAGHDCKPRPGSIQQGRGVCRTCAGQDPIQAEKECRATLIAAGHTPMWTAWLGTDRPHQVRCVNGHDCKPRPSSIQQGRGPCPICACQLANVFYVVESPLCGDIKFGHTSNDPRPRLAVHRSEVYASTILYLATELPIGRGRVVESIVLAELGAAGFSPWRGR